MLAGFLVTLREGFEAALLVAVVLAYLVRTGREHLAPAVWAGVGSAAVLSLLVAGSMFAISFGLEGAGAQIFKGGAMWLAVGFLTYMILWMRRQSGGIVRGIRADVDAAVGRKRGGALALAALAFVMVFREGLETSLFMFGIVQLSTPLQAAVGGALGMLAAFGLGYAVYAGGRRLNLGVFFKVTGALLIIVAAGLLARGVAMFEYAGLFPALVYPLWDLSGTALLTGQSYVGQFLISFLGWDPRPDLLEFGAWVFYLLVVGYAFLRPQRAFRGVQASS